MKSQAVIFLCTSGPPPQLKGLDTDSGVYEKLDSSGREQVVKG